MKELSIKNASILTGLSVHTIRAWEKRYAAVQPRRSTNGRRTYTYEEVERFRLLRKTTDSGHLISEVASLSDDQLRQLDTFELTAPSQESTVNKIMQALLSFRIDEVDSILIRSITPDAPDTFIHQIALPTLHAVGTEVEKKNCTVAQEHALSASIRNCLGTMLLKASGRKKSRHAKVLVATTPEGDFHELGTLMGCLLAAHHGYSVHYLGPSLPLLDLKAITRKLKPDAILLGCSYQPTRELQDRLDRYLSALERVTKGKVAIWTGGSAMHAVAQTRSGSRSRTFDSMSRFAKFLVEAKQQ